MVSVLSGELVKRKKMVQLTKTHEDFGKKENVNVDHPDNFFGC